MSNAFVPHQRVYTTEVLDWSHGSGLVVPKNSLIVLEKIHNVNGTGLRWSGNWQRQAKLTTYVYPIPEDCIRAEVFQLCYGKTTLPETYNSVKQADSDAQRLSVEHNALVFVFDCNLSEPKPLHFFERGRKFDALHPARHT